MVTKHVRPTNGVIAVEIDRSRERTRAAALEVIGTIREAGFDIAYFDGCEEVLNVAPTTASIDDAVLLVTIGGDGTLLRAAQTAAPRSIPLFGVNTGRMGFLTEVDGSQARAVLAEILRDGFLVEERSALEASVFGRTYFALNDIVVRRVGTSHMTPFGLFIDGREAAHVPSDGFAVATPTGSTAYFLSAGGPIIAPDVDAFGLVALLPHTLFSRPLVVPGHAKITLICDSQNEHATLEADGRTAADLGPGDRVDVARYASPVHFARRTPLNFFALLEAKMRWNAPIKEAR
ncbi:MAG TPA: NAD(+)/NADH kinase [Candidatus Baltobacteraceae bacterium]|jgi:NAD+ kinase|nr:NAD(+)/NADH kinase [Candidatus Baltobacteraceae bacterium]